MRVAIWLVGLFSAAVALALFTGDNDGTVTIFWPPHRVDMSVNLVLLLLMALFALLYFALRAIAALFELPRQAKRWRSQQRERAAHTSIMDAITQFTAGRYLRARKAAEVALAREQALREAGDVLPHRASLRALAHLAVAESAHALQDQATRDTHLALALDRAVAPGAPPELREGVLLRAARWALNDRDPIGAMARLDELPAGATRRTAALRIKLKAARQAGQQREALETARLLAKHGAFSREAAATLVRSLAADQVAHAHDAAQLQQVWASLEPSDRATPELALRAAQRLLNLGGDHATVRHWLRPAWDAMLAQPDSFSPAQRARLARALEAGLAPTATDAADAADAQWLARVESAYQSHPRDATLQYLAGMACLHRGLWGKAQLLLTQAVRSLQDEGLRARAWKALAELAEQRGDEAAASDAWKRAANG
jgi:HemY protein